ncbi:MAG: HAD hydrolase family protein [Candidatus Levybacteria bacterium]|nr:HAD hydrolase family protein [Candidatus Levybacteria bacterium]
MSRLTPEAKGKKVIFADVDGTLAFHEGTHKLQFVDFNEDGTANVTHTEKSKSYRGHRILYDQKRGQGIFVDQRTIELCHQLAEDFDWICVTGAGYESLHKRTGVLDFFKGYVIENGGLVMDGDFKEDEKWMYKITDQVAYLHAITEHLKEEGWVIDPGRKASVRLRLEQNPKKSAADLSRVRSEVRQVHRAHGIKATVNLGHLDIIPKNAGKGNAIDYVFRKMGYDPRTIGIGDDINDLSMLEYVAERYIVGSSHPEIVEIARTRRWYVSRGTYIDGINEILRKIVGNK